MAEVKQLESIASPHSLVIYINENYHQELLLQSYSLVNRYQMNTNYADDLLQDFYFTVFNKWETFKKGLQKTGYSYLAKSLKNEMINQNRKETAMKRREKAFSESRDSKGSIFNLCMDLYEMKFFDMLSKILSKEEFSVMELYVKGYHYYEIAQILDIKEGTVGSRMSRARKKITEHMETH